MSKRSAAEAGIDGADARVAFENSARAHSSLLSPSFFFLVLNQKRMRGAQLTATLSVAPMDAC